MITLTAAQAAGFIEGELIAADPQIRINGVSVDSRTVGEGILFFALKGEHRDGHEFVNAALSAGASGAVVSRQAGFSPADGKFIIITGDVLTALGRLAAAIRLKSNFKVVGITGSSGKTTVRCMLQGILSRRFNTVSSEKNYNNEIGVPLTLLKADEQTGIMIVEMAMRARGEIRELCAMARPDFGIITNIGLSHFETLSTKENIALAKKELIESLPEGAPAVLNRDDKWTGFVSEGFEGKIIYFGFSEDADVKPVGVEYDEEGRAMFQIETPDGPGPRLKLQYAGEHQVLNALAAAAAAYGFFGAGGEDIKAGLESYTLEGMRMESFTTRRGYRVINDSYNANPDSVRAALKALSKIKVEERRVAVLGDMLELGSISRESHYRLGQEVAGAGVTLLVTVGKESISIGEGIPERYQEQVTHVHFDDNDSAISFLKDELRPGDGILIKGSRAMKLEEITEAVRAA